MTDKLQQDLKQLKIDLKELLDNSKSIILSLSFGKDSLLLLYLLKDLGYDVPVLSFNALWNSEQKVFVKRMVKEHDLKVFFYRPNRLSVIDESVVSFYQVGSRELPIIQDIIYDEKRCGIDVGKKVLDGTPVPPFLWDSVIVGSKKSDFHPLKQAQNWDEFSTKNIKFHTPLWNWNDEEIWEVIEYLKIPTDDRVYKDNNERASTGNANLCLSCISKKEGFVFCPKEQKEIPVLK